MKIVMTKCRITNDQKNIIRFWQRANARTYTILKFLVVIMTNDDGNYAKVKTSNFGAAS